MRNSLPSIASFSNIFDLSGCGLRSWARGLDCLDVEWPLTALISDLNLSALLHALNHKIPAVVQQHLQHLWLEHLSICSIHIILAFAALQHLQHLFLGDCCSRSSHKLTQQIFLLLSPQFSNNAKHSRFFDCDICYAIDCAMSGLRAQIGHSVATSRPGACLELSQAPID